MQSEKKDKPKQSKTNGNKGKRKRKAMDAYHRMNFLLQAAHQTKTVVPDASRHYIKTLNGVSRRLVLRLSPEVKHNLCKSCGVVLIPGHNKRVRLHAGSPGYQSCTCLECGNVVRTVFEKEQKVLVERRGGEDYAKRRKQEQKRHRKAKKSK